MRGMMLGAFALFFWGCNEPQAGEQTILAGAQCPVMPAPHQVETPSNQDTLLVGGLDWDFSAAADWSDDGRRWRDEWMDGVFPNGKAARKPLVFDHNTTWPAERYRLQVDETGIRIIAGGRLGAIWGLVSLRQLMPIPCENGNCGWVGLPHVRFEDEPRYHHRGLLLDCCRHFMEPEFVKHIIDQLALHKMNVLHWHLTEDQGWRMAIDAYPKLTEVGAWRTEADGSLHGGYYTKDQIRDIVDHAALRGVTIIPEIELPGHSRAAIAAYPWLSCTGEALEVPHDWGVFKDIYCAGNDETLDFLKTVMDEALDLFPSRFIHIGGDEAPKVRWAACPKCQARIQEQGLHDEHDLQSWFINQIGEHLASRGRVLVGWDEILEGGIPDGATVQSWRGVQGGIDALQSGHDAIFSPTSHCYFDYPLAATDMREVYEFGAVLESVPAGTPGRLLGGECNMWSEHAPQNLVDSKVFPRLVAISEVLWGTADATDSGWHDFLNRLDCHYERLEAWDVDYGLETVPVAALASRSKGQLEVEVKPAMRGVTGMAGFFPAGADDALEIQTLPAHFTIQEVGEVRVEINHRQRLLNEPERFSVAGHLGLSAEHVYIQHDLNPYYPGGGEVGLVDGWRGSDDFRDGHWQAAQGEDMRVDLVWPEQVHIDSVTLQFYVYQDAWIFLPERLDFAAYVSSDEVEIDVWNGSDLGWEAWDAPSDAQGRKSVTLPLGIQTHHIWLEAFNPGPCPEWHDASTEPTWLFMDEVIVHGHR